jgi:hypothetical protein
MVVPAQQLAPQGHAAPQGSPYAPQGHAAPQGSPYRPPPHGGPAQPPYSPHGTPPAPGYLMPPPRPRSSKGLVIGLSVGAVAIAGTIAGIVLATGGSSGSSVGSRDDLVKRTLAAVNEGDVEKLVKLSDPVGLYNRSLDCSERDKSAQDKDTYRDADRQEREANQKDGEDKQDAEDKKPADGEKRSGGDAAPADSADDTDDDPQIQEKRVRRKHEKLVEKTKGSKIELISIEGAGAEKDKAEGDADKADGGGKRAKGRSKQLMKKGDKAPSGCVFKVDVELHEIVAKVRVTPPDGKAPSEGQATLLAVDAGGSWFLWAAPTISGGAGAIAEQLRKYRDQLCACKDVACTEAVHKALKDWEETVPAEPGSLPKNEQQMINEIDDQMKDCRRKIAESDEAAVVKEMLAKLEGFKDKVCACADVACTDRVGQEMLDFSKSLSQAKDVKGSAGDEARAKVILEEYKACAEKVKTASTTSDDPMPPEDPSSGKGTGTSSGKDTGTSSGKDTGTSSGKDTGTSSGKGLSSVPECAEYRRQIDKMRTCRKYPSTAVDSLKQGYEQMERSWGSIRSNAAAREQMTKACQTTADSLKKIRQQMCP